jgi:hypothetical protein
MKNYTFHLLFESLGHTEWYQIFEPTGFDGANFEIEQNSKRYSRDVVFGAVDKLTFVDAVSGIIGTEQVINPLGDVSKRLDNGLAWHFETLKLKGFESVTLFQIRLDGVSLRTFTLDYTSKDLTDGYSYINCILKDNNNVADFKRYADDKFNAFSDKDVKGNTITPVQTMRYLHRATPQTNISKFKGNGQTADAFSTTSTFGGSVGTIGALCNNANVIEQGDINNTLSFLSNTFAQGSAFSGGILYPIPNNTGSFQLIEAKNDFSSVNVKISGVNAQTLATINNATNPTSPSLATQVTSASGKIRLLLIVGGFDLEVDSFTAYTLWTKNYANMSAFNSVWLNDVPTDFNLTIPSIERSQRMYLYFACDSNATFNNTLQLASANVYLRLFNMNIEITATETAIDSVIPAVKYIDFIKQGVKSIKDVPVDAPLFDTDGIHNKQVVFCRRMISQKTDYFYSTFKETLGSVEEVNCDYEINEDNIQIRNFEGFYENTEIGAFLIKPDADYNCQFNERLQVKNFDYGYKKYAQDRNIIGSTTSIHTDSNWIVPNTQVENKKEIKNDFVRDGKYIQDIFNLEIKQPTTSLEADNDVMIEQYVELAPNSFGSFGARLLMQWTENPTPFTSILKILNRDSNGDSGDVVINWLTIGVEVGNTFEITNGVNVGTYEITEITSTLLTLRNTSNITIFNGDGYIKVKYFYSNVAYQTRTNQGFTIPTTGVLPNIFYSIKRNMKYFSSLFASYMLFNKTFIRCNEYKNNRTFESQLTSESSVLVEDVNFNYSDFDEPILGAKTHDITLVVDYNSVKNILIAYLTNKGFIRCYDAKEKVIKGFIQKLKYNWLTNLFECTIEEKYESEILTLTFVDGVLNVNDVAYNLSGVSNWWKTQNDYIKFYDKNSKPICNNYKYNFVLLNGISYNSIELLVNALNDL